MFYGAAIPTTVLVFKKCRKNPDNILFIDASLQFDKVKTTNVLRPEHIQKIVDTYKARTNKDKYSHVATIESIKANDYNLNIPRYVDTFEAENAIDLAAISAQLIELDKSSKTTDATIAVFCKELGIEPPFSGQQA
jgi:type I restriction enzyme M protein